MDKELLAAAWVARQNAYAPYSGYAVGAALRAEDGRIFTGCNVENASYGLSMCAERVAIGSAAAAGQRKFSALCVVAEGDVPWPCGACRQVLNEFAPDLLVVVQAGDAPPLQRTLSELLPESFRLQREE